MNFGKVPVNTISTRNFRIKNVSPRPVTLQIRLVEGTGFTVSTNEFFLYVGDSITVSVSFSPQENLSYKNTLFVTEFFEGYSNFITLRGEGAIETLYDAVTFDKWDGALKTALNNLVINHTSLGYNTGRDRMFENIDKRSGDTIECVYTGIKIQAANRTIAQNLGFNTEHTWPQSFFSEAEPMRSDIFHLYPTEANANNKRSNYDFGNVVSGVTWEVGGSKLGRNYLNQIVFEPREVHKGDVARSLFYFVTRYQDYGSYLDTLQQSVLRGWSLADSVSAAEYARNGKIALYQGKRNPFIDHPEFISRIYSFTQSGATTFTPEAILSADTMRLDVVWVGEGVDSSYAWLYLGNIGRGSLSYQLGSLISDEFRVYSNNDTVNFGGVDSILVVFAPQVLGFFNTEILISSNAGVQRIPLFGRAISGDAGDPEVGQPEFRLIGNFPNPFNNETTIRYSLSKEENISIKLFTVNGEEVKQLFIGQQSAGVHSLRLQMEGLTTGMYYVRLSGTNGISSLSILYLK